jgi:sugar/nucleoside kinase (ribokinase family)
MAVVVKTTERHPQLVIIGQATIDDIRREPRGESFPRTLGGDALYSVVGASMWPISIGVIAIVGNDYPREKLEAATCNPGLTDWTGIRYDPGPSIHDTARYYADGTRLYDFDDASLLEKLSPGLQDLPAAWRASRYVHVAPFDIQRQLELVRHFAAQHALVSLDVETHFVTGKTAALMSILRLGPIFIPSLEHVRMLSGASSSDPAALRPWIRSCGAPTVVVKCGSEGAWVIKPRENTLWEVGVVPGVRIEDVTGAGDAFCGGFMAGLALRKDDVEAAAYGAVSASYVVESLGASRPPHFNPSDAGERLRKVLKAVRRTVF